jgi:DNA helicase-2/ATP-dependent DNA helicase PcrA
MVIVSKFLEGLNPSQVKAVTTIDGPIQVNATAGSGKCVTGDTLVFTNKGILPIRDIPKYFPVVNDHCKATVVSMNLSTGTEKVSTSHWFNMGMSKTIRIETSLGYEVEGTPEHPVLVMQGTELTYKQLKDIKENDLVVLSKNNDLWGDDNSISEEQAYLIGLLIGDGYIARYGEISFAKSDEQFSSRYCDLFEKLYGIRPKRNQHSKNKGSVSWHVYSTGIWNHLQSIGLEMSTSEHKKIPQCIMNAPAPVVIECIRGIFDTDGSINDRGFEHSTKSRELHFQLKAILSNLGIISKTNKRVNKYGTHYRLIVSGENLRIFRDKVGFKWATHKVEGLEAQCRKKVNSNLSYRGQETILKSLFDKYSHLPCFKGISKLEGETGVLTYGEYANGRKGLTTRAIKIILECLPPCEETQHLRKLLDIQLDPVTKISFGRDIVYDFTVPTNHSFVGNGIVLHNTRVLTHRVAYMIEELGIKPSSIMLTTFTKKATEEMTERLAALIPKMKLMQITIGTTHSIGYRILAKEYENMDHPLAVTFKKRNILMNGRLKVFVDQVIKDIMYDRTVEFTVKEQLKDIAVPQLMKAIGLSKNEGIGWEEYEMQNSGKGARMEAYIEFYKRYELKKFAERAIDADDMLYLTWKLFKEHPDILQKYQRIYKYVMVDEAQDNNKLNYDLVRMISAPEHNLFVVGDDDQSMYSFRGAKPEEFIEFTKNYRGAKQIALEDNYRSNPAILNVANNLIKHNTNRLVKTLKPHKQDNSDCVSYSRYKDEGAEAKDIAEDIKVQVEKKGRNHRDIAILYRTNAQSRAVEDALIMAGLPYVIHGGVSFYERKEVKDLVAYLQLVINPNNNKAFERVINVPSRYLGKAFLEKVKAFKGSHWEAIQPGVLNLKRYEQEGTGQFISLITTLQDMMKKGATPTELIDYILKEGGYEKYIVGEDDEEESSRLENISTLKFVLDRYKKVEDFLEYIELMTSKAKHSIDGVQLLTIHKSKGLEFPVCYIIGVNEGLLPHFKSIEDFQAGTKPYAIEEERRLLYVAITRAEEECYISSTDSFNGRLCPASRFVPELGLNTVSKEEED